jgi:bromodomain-containing factor 1
MNHEHSVDSGHTDPITPDVVPAPLPNGNANGVTKLNGGLQRDPSPPALDSPATPVSNAAAPDVKIDAEFHEQEGGVHHEPISIKPIATVDSKPAVTTIDDASVDAQNGIVADPGPSFSCPMTAHSHQNFLESYLAVIPVDPLLATPPPQTGDSLEDVTMAEQLSVPHGVHHDADIHMEDGDVDPPTSPPTAEASIGEIDASGVSMLSPVDDEELKPPPAKRPRVHSDADQASLAHVSRLCVFPPFVMRTQQYILISQVCNTAAGFHCSESCSATECHDNRHFCTTHVCTYTTSLHPFWAIYTYKCPATFLPVNCSQSQKNQGRCTVPTTSRPCCA